MDEELKTKLIEALIAERYASDVEEAEEILCGYEGTYADIYDYCESTIGVEYRHTFISPYIDYDKMVADMFFTDKTRFEMQLDGQSHIFLAP